MIRHFRDQDMTVFLSSHLLSEVAEVCDSVIFLDRGKVVTSDSVEGINRRVGHATLDVKFLRPLSPEDIGRIKGIGLIKGVDVKNGTARLRYDGQPETSAHILSLLVSLDLDVVSYAPGGVGLEEYYVSVMGDARGESTSMATNALSVRNDFSDTWLSLRSSSC